MHKEIEIEYDAEAKLSELNAANMKWYNFTGPYGVGFSIPIYRFNNLKIISAKEIKGGHVKMTVEDFTENSSDYLTNKCKVDILYFTPPEEKKNLILQHSKNGKNSDILIDILGEIQINYFNKSESVQILMKDFLIHD